MNVFTGLWLFVRGLWRSVLGGLVMQAALDILDTVGREAVDDLTTLAREKALKLEEEFPSGQGQGALKRDRLLAYLRDVLTQRGLSISAVVLNFVIESVVISIKGGS